MGFGTVLILVLIALIILSILFTIFKFFIGLLPAAIIVVLVIWLIYKFDNKNNTKSYPTANSNVFNKSNNPSGRKKARNVTVKDVKEDKRGKDNG